MADFVMTDELEVEDKPKKKRGEGRRGTGKKQRAARQVLEELSDELDREIDPLREMAKIAVDDDSPLKLKAEMWTKLSPYIHPTLRSVEVSGNANGGLQITPKIMMGLTDEELDFLERLLKKIETLSKGEE